MSAKKFTAVLIGCGECVLGTEPRDVMVTDVDMDGVYGTTAAAGFFVPWNTIAALAPKQPDGSVSITIEVE